MAMCIVFVIIKKISDLYILFNRNNHFSDLKIRILSP